MQPASPTEMIDALLGSELAAEVRSEFDAKVGVGLPVDAATAATLDRFRPALLDPDDGPVVLIALAALQWRESALQPVIRDAVLGLIDSGEAVRAYRPGDGDLRRRREELLTAFARALRGVVLR